MADINGPVIVRDGTVIVKDGPVIVRDGAVGKRHNTADSFIKPGLHSYNSKRRVAPARYAPLNAMRLFFYIVGICALGYYGYVLANQYVYQAFENWAFDQQIANGRAVTFTDYLREKTPLGFLVGKEAPGSEATTAKSSPPPEISEPARPVEGSVLGRVEIKRLNVSAMVLEGADAKILKISVGHVPSTSLPGETGNFAIAAHRDTLFRALKDIKKGDLVTFQAPTATYTYEVEGTKIVKPSNIAVLQPDGGGVIPATDNGPGDGTKLLTMITCYPFYYVGAAPKRFIVESKLISTAPTQAAENVGIAAAAGASTSTTEAKSVPPRQPKKRRHFWHKVSRAL